MHLNKMMRPIGTITMIAFVALISACTTTTASLKTFDFGLPVARATEAKMSVESAVTPLSFKLADISVSNNLDTEAMHYRLLYNNAQELLPYTQSRWSMPPAQLLSQRIKSYINNLGGMVVSANESSYDLPILRIELEEFSQHFTSPSTSYALVQLRASFTHHNRVIAQKLFSAKTNSSSADAAGGAQAMPLATDLLLSELTAWIQLQAQQKSQGQQDQQEQPAQPQKNIQ